MKQYLFASLLLLGVTSCGGGERLPDGSRISGPTVETGLRNSKLTYTLTYSIQRPNTSRDSSLAHLQDLAADAVSAHDQVGEYKVVYRDEETHHILYQAAFEVESDLMSQKTIQRLY